MSQNKEGSLSTHHVVAKLDDVLRHYVKDFELEGEIVISHNAWVDLGKREVVFQLVTKAQETGE